MHKLLKSAFVPNMEAQIKRFPEKHRSCIRRLVRQHDYTTDLLNSFPALAFALATDYGAEEDRNAALRLIKNGQPLRFISEAFGLPYWLRKVPPEAFQNKLAVFPMDPEFNRKIAGALPLQWNAMANWLEYVPKACAYANEEFAIWLSKQKIFKEEYSIALQIYTAAAYAWFSQRPETFAGGLIEKAWSKSATYETVMQHVSLWLNNMKVKLCFGSGGISDSWLSPGQVGGYSFVPLLTADALKDEGQRMDHCVADYTLSVAHNGCRIFSVRRGGKHIATLEIQNHVEHPGIPAIEQLYGHSNAEVPQAVWQATFAWLAKQEEYKLPSYNNEPDLDVTIWKQLWAPYWEEKGENAWLPTEPSPNTISEMIQQVQ
ncbi:MAG: PcfJ domain-containing protein [Methyloligellaceae bacterium]